jgi:lipopolysaccharide export system permease protein
VLDPNSLTPEGRKRIFPAGGGTGAFIISDCSFDYLCNAGRNTRLISSNQLIERIRKPAAGAVSVRAQSLALHARITRPILCLLSIALALPLVLRRESISLISNLAVCAAVLGVFYGITQACLAVGTREIFSPDTAAWIPVVLNGMAAAWTSTLVQT